MARPARPTTTGKQAMGPKILRACIVQGGKVLEEKRLKKRQTLTIGTSPHNTFVIADPKLPHSHDLFVNKGGRYELVFTEAMRGKISAHGGGTPVDFSALKSQGMVKKKGSAYHLTLTDSHRGKVIIGDATIIFQFVTAPPVRAKPKLPVATRGSLIKSIDWVFAAILAAVFAVEAPVFVLFQFVDPPADLTLDDLAGSRFADLIVPNYEPEEEKPELPKDEVKGTGQTKKAAKAKKAVDDGDPEAAAKKAAARKTSIRKEIGGKGILAILGTAGEGSASGAVADVFRSGTFGGDLDAAFDGIAGVGLATVGSGRTTRGGGSGEAASIGGLATAGGGKVGLKGKAERRVGAVKASAPDVDGSLDSAAIAKVVRGRMRSIQDCYERELKRDPNLSGKIEIEITIGESGRVEEASVVSNSMGSSAVGNCIVGRIRRWRFPKSDSGSTTVTCPFIFTGAS